MSLETRISVLAISANPFYREQLAAEFSSTGLEVTFCKKVAAAQSLLRHQDFHLVFCEDMVPPHLRRVVRHASSIKNWIPIVVCSCRSDWTSYLDVLRSGAFDRFVLPAARGELTRIVDAALRESFELVNQRMPASYNLTMRQQPISMQ